MRIQQTNIRNMDQCVMEVVKNRFLKKEGKGMMLAAQEEPLQANYINFSIDKTSHTSLCRRITRGCSKLT